MLGRCPLCKSEGVEHPGNELLHAGASCSNERCILHINNQDYVNVHVLLTQWPQPCVFEHRDANGNHGQTHGVGRAWCRVHGFGCPELNK